MAIIYGINKSKKEILKLAPNYLKENPETIIEDIQKFILKYEEDVKLDKKQFIENYEYVFEEHKQKLKTIYDAHELKLKEINSNLSGASFFKKFFLKNIQLPAYIKSYNKKIETEEKKIKEIEENPESLFTNSESTTYFKLKKLKELKNNSYYSKAILEQQLLNELIKLNEKFTVICGLEIDFKKLKYKKLKKNKFNIIYFDFVIVSKKGIYLLNLNFEKLHLNQVIKKDYDKKIILQTFISMKKTFETYLKQNLSIKDIAITESRLLGIYVNNFGFNFLDSEIKEIDASKILEEINKNEDNLYNTEIAGIINFLKNYID